MAATEKLDLYKKHKAEYVTGYLAAVDEAFGEIAAAIKDGRPEGRLKGPVCHSGFERLT